MIGYDMILYDIIRCHMISYNIVKCFSSLHFPSPNAIDRAAPTALARSMVGHRARDGGFPRGNRPSPAAPG